MTNECAWSFASYFEMLLPVDQAEALLVIGLALSCYRKSMPLGPNLSWPTSEATGTWSGKGGW